jgi:hypothetical protein
VDGYPNDKVEDHFVECADISMRISRPHRNWIEQHKEECEHSPRLLFGGHLKNKVKNTELEDQGCCL